MVVDVSLTYRNIGDLGADGHVWALDQATQQFQMWRIGTNAYCIKRLDVGTFTSFAGLSPEGTGTIQAGITGPFVGLSYIRVSGKFEPAIATTGSVGDFNGQCQQDGTCLGEEPRLIRRYFSRVNAIDFGVFVFTANGGACGIWIQTSTGNTGDIVC
jgi:hypothetical protein